MLEDIQLYKDAVTLSVANMTVEKKMFKAASMIFKHMNNHIDAVTCLITNSMVDEALIYAREVKDSNAWRQLCKHFL